MSRKIALAKHYLMRAAWAVLPARAKGAIWRHHRANLKPLIR